jgi:hypothetical protein
VLPPPFRDGSYLEIANAGDARPIAAIGNARPIVATKAIAPSFGLLIIDLLLTRDWPRPSACSEARVAPRDHNHKVLLIVPVGRGSETTEAILTAI